MKLFWVVFLLQCNVDTLQNGSDIDTVAISSNVDRLGSDQVVIQLDRLNERIANQNVWNILIPLIVVLMGGLLALIQIKANVISVARIKWNEELRKNLSEFISFLSVLQFEVEEVIELNRRDPASAKSKVLELTNKYKRLTEVEYQIKMLLNNTDLKHQSLLNAIDSIDREFKKFGSDPKYVIDIDLIEKDVAQAGQAVLKDSWDAAKSLNVREMFRIKWG